MDFPAMYFSRKHHIQIPKILPIDNWNWKTKCLFRWGKFVYNCCPVINFSFKYKFHLYSLYPLWIIYIITWDFPQLNFPIDTNSPCWTLKLMSLSTWNRTGFKVFIISFSFEYCFIIIDPPNYNIAGSIFVALQWRPARSWGIAKLILLHRTKD